MPASGRALAVIVSGGAAQPGSFIRQAVEKANVSGG